ncbi:Lrp/AsnC ligand binding domain-containing protein [Fodinicola feengrottensis]
MSGDNDLVLFVRTRDAESLRDLVLERLQMMEDVLSTHTILVFDEL